MLIGFTIMLASWGLIYAVLLGGIRPYLRHRGSGGAARFGGSWADWQVCWEIARSEKDPKASLLASLFLVFQAGRVAGLLLAIAGI